MSNPAITTPIVAPQSNGGIPQFQAPAPAYGSPRMAAIETMNNDNAKLTALNKAAQGGARRRRRGGGAITVLPPGPTPIYKDTLAGTPYGASNQSTGTMVTQLNQTSQSQYDNQVQLVPIPKTGGRRTKKWGGVKWGCYSGGKRKSRRRSKKSRKSRRK
jgi:hypothetical protein